MLSCSLESISLVEVYSLFKQAYPTAGSEKLSGTLRNSFLLEKYSLLLDITIPNENLGVLPSSFLVTYKNSHLSGFQYDVRFNGTPSIVCRSAILPVAASIN